MGRRVEGYACLCLVRWLSNLQNATQSKPSGAALRGVLQEPHLSSLEPEQGTTERPTVISKQTNGSTRQAGKLAQVAMIGGLLLAGAWAAPADDADARFRGTGKADPVRIAMKPADGKGAGAIAFDLAWDHSWRAAWEVNAEQTGGSGPLKLESWDAAWVFVKFHKPGDDGW